MFQSNISLGREVELYERVRLNDPANSVLVACVIASPAEAQAVMRTYDTFAALLAANPEVTNGDYSRIVLSNTDLSAPVVDDAANTITLSLPIFNWNAGGGVDAGDAWDFVIVGYDPDSTTPGDSAIVPITGHELRGPTGVAGVPNGSPIVVDFSAGWLAASQR